MKRHDELKQDVPAYVAGQLGTARREELEVHFATCDVCAELVLAAEAIAEGVRREAGSAHVDHPAFEALLAYARDPRESPAVEQHLAYCESCALEVEAWRRRDPGDAAAPVAAFAPSTPVTRSARRWPALVAAAALGAAATLLVVLLMPGSLMPDRPTIAGPAPYLRLEQPPRGGETPPRVLRVPAGTPRILLLVPVARPRPEDRTTGFSLEVVDAAGQVTWKREVTRDDVLARVEPTRPEPLAFSLPTVDHPPGRYTLLLRMRRDGRDDVILEQVFELVP